MDDEQKNTTPVSGDNSGTAPARNRNRNRHRHGKHPHPQGGRPRENDNLPEFDAEDTDTDGGGEKSLPMPDSVPAPRKKDNPRPHHKNGNRPRPNDAGESAHGEPRRGGNPPEKHGNNNGNGKNNENRNRGGNDGQKNFRREKRGSFGYSDPYGIPSPKDQQILNDLRAQIVLKSADGSVPARNEKKKDAGVFPRETAVPAGENEQPQIIPDEILFSDPLSMSRPASGSVEIVGIRFRASGKVYYFDPDGQKLSLGDQVILNTAIGQEFGEVELPNRMIPKNRILSPLRKVLRIANDDDVRINRENREKEQEALAVCRQKVAEHNLKMKLVDVQFAFDHSKLLFYFTAEDRVDFRELVRELARVFHTRIELRQIGIRDEAKMLGGLGACGRPLCCSTFLSDFAQVTIKMAKEQGLSLNSTKISGTCGRLLCCLRYESDVYSEEIRKTPSNDSVVRTPDGVGKVISSSPLAATVRVVLQDSPDAPPKQYSRDEVVVLEHGKKG